MPHVQAMSWCTVEVHAGVQVQALAAEPASFSAQPGHQSIGMPCAPLDRQRGQVVDVQIVPPGQSGDLPEAGDSDRGRFVVSKDPDQPVAHRAQPGVDHVDELAGGPPAGAQREHGISHPLGGSLWDLLYLEHRPDGSRDTIVALQYTIPGGPSTTGAPVDVVILR